MNNIEEVTKTSICEQAIMTPAVTTPAVTMPAVTTTVTNEVFKRRTRNARKKLIRTMMAIV